MSIVLLSKWQLSKCQIVDGQKNDDQCKLLKNWIYEGQAVKVGDPRFKMAGPWSALVRFFKNCAGPRPVRFVDPWSRSFENILFLGF